MIRRSVYKLAIFLAIVLVAGCGHDGEIDVRLPPEGPLPEPVTITGGVLAPRGILAAETSLLHRFASLIVPPALALSDIVQPIGSGDRVSLKRLSNVDAADGVIDEAQFVSADSTEFGRFAVPLDKGAELGECGLFLQVGSGSGIMRAFVYRDDQDISAVSETVVRLVLDYRATHSGSSICAFSLDEIGDLITAVTGASTSTGATTVEELNDRVEDIANASGTILDLVESFGSF